MMNFKYFAFLVPVFLVSGCSLSRMAANTTSDLMVKGSPVLEEESDVELAQQSSFAMLKTLEVFQHAEPENKNFLLLLSKSYGSYAFGFLENDLIAYKPSDLDGKKRSPGNPELYQQSLTRAKLFYQRGRDYGLALLKLQNPSLYDAVKGPIPALNKAVKKLGKNDIPAAFWTAFSWGNLINLNKDDPSVIVDLSRVEMLMGRIRELDPSYNNAGPELFYGVYYASRPTMLGGNPEQALKDFDAASGLTKNRFLFVPVLKAQFYATQNGDKALFESLLKDVLAADPAMMPSQILANKLAQKRAALLLERSGNFF